MELLSRAMEFLQHNPLMTVVVILLLLAVTIWMWDYLGHRG